MDATSIRERFRNSSEWTIVELFMRLQKLEAEIAALKTPQKAPRKKAVRNGVK